MTPTTRSTMEELREILAEEFERLGCSMKAARVRNQFTGDLDVIAALAAMSRTTHAGEGMVEAILAICADHKARADVPKRDDWQLGYAAACREIAVDVRRLSPSKPAPVVNTGPKWQSYDHEDKSTWPTQVGVYRVMVSGDSESLDGHTIYDYPDYPTWAEAFVDEDNGEEIVMFGQGTHDEEADTFFAYCGPFSIPEFSEKALTPPQATEEKS